jgi:xylulokinase
MPRSFKNERRHKHATRREILRIGFSGQMHGLGLLDQDERLLRPAIIWGDQRSAGLLPEIAERVGLPLLAQRFGTASTAGFETASVQPSEPSSTASRYCKGRHQTCLVSRYHDNARSSSQST